MALYRILQNVVWGETLIPRGAMSSLAGISGKSIRILEERGAIAKVSPPPLAVLPGWTIRAARLSKININTVLDLLDADLSVVAKHMRVNVETARHWYVEAETWLKGPPEGGG